MANCTLAELNTRVNQAVKNSHSVRKPVDFIVLGLGSMGSSTCYQLAKRGFKVLGLEQFAITHENGSHAGQSRLIRQAYFEHPDYVPLLKEAYMGWENLENESDSKLFYETGILYSGIASDFLISGSLESARQYDLTVNKISYTRQRERFPQFNLPSHYTTIFEPKAGFVTPERAILAYVAEAMKAGAIIRSNEKVLSWREQTNSVVVRTDKEQYTASRLIITAGAWTEKLIPQIRPKIKVTKQAIFWVNVNKKEQYMLPNMPCWGINQEDLPGLFYGFPILNKNAFGGPNGLKIGYHYPGETTDPDSGSLKVKRKDEEIIISFMDKFMPGAFKSLNEAKICLYTYSPDDHFIIDFHPEYRNVLIATGFSGHGFKFIPIVGEIMADLAIRNETEHPINFLRLR